MSRDSGLDLERVREGFDRSTDFTIGLEEEFALLDPGSLDLVPAFEPLFQAARADPVLADSVTGELISSEIEIRSGRCTSFEEAVASQRRCRRRLFELAAAQDLRLAATGAHPWADYRDQEIIDTPHYRRVGEELQWVARRNNTWSLHVHVGIKGADRAVSVCDHLRELLPLLLAASANSPYLDGEDTGLASIRTQIFTRTFPRCGVPESFGDWRSYASFVDLLASTGSIVESTQLWWSVRPHHAFGTVEVRVCDAQSDGEISTALAGLIAAAVVQVALDYDEHGYAGSGAAPFGPGAGPPLRGREIEENLWRAIRNGTSGEQVDFRSGMAAPTAELLGRLWEWCAPAREVIAADVAAPGDDTATGFRRLIAETGDLHAAFREVVESTALSYAGGDRGRVAAGQGRDDKES